jgi:hypothetical protein
MALSTLNPPLPALEDLIALTKSRFLALTGHMNTNVGWRPNGIAFFGETKHG